LIDETGTAFPVSRASGGPRSEMNTKGLLASWSRYRVPRLRFEANLKPLKGEAP
jgi:hypothetical protein